MYTGPVVLCHKLSDVHRDLLYCVTNCLMYTGPVVLCHKLSDVHRDLLYCVTNCLILCTRTFVVIYWHFILTSPTLCGEYSEFAHDVLVSFVQHFSQIYGPEMLVYNVHNLVHPTEDARRYGPLDNFSAFPFENDLFSMRKMVRKPQQATQQVVRRMAETFHNRNQQLANIPVVHCPFMYHQMNVCNRGLHKLQGFSLISLKVTTA